MLIFTSCWVWHPLQAFKLMGHFRCQLKNVLMGTVLNINFGVWFEGCLHLRTRYFLRQGWRQAIERLCRSSQGDWWDVLGCLASPVLIYCKLCHSLLRRGRRLLVCPMCVFQEEQEAALCLILRHWAGPKGWGTRWGLNRHCSLFDSLDSCVGQATVGDQGPRGAEILGLSTHLFSQEGFQGRSLTGGG